MRTPLVLTQQFDSTTWQALGLVLTVAGLLLSVVVWRRAGAGRGLRAAAWSLVPLAAGLTGLLRLGWDIADAVLRWAVRLVFSPVVWLGIVVAMVALVLHVAGGVLLRRSGRSAPARGVAGGPEKALYAAPAAPRAPRASKPQQDSRIEDQDDIEAILRKHGIS
jgi:hypothetical protein